MTASGELSGAGQGQAASPDSGRVSLVRLYLLRATYLLLVVGLGVEIWPGIINHAASLPLMDGVVMSVLGAVAVLALLGLRYPLQMLPLLVFELVWKLIWLIAFALPLALAGRVDASIAPTIVACLMGVIFPIVIPWPYLVTHFFAKPGDRWT